MCVCACVCACMFVCVCVCARVYAHACVPHAPHSPAVVGPSVAGVDRTLQRCVASIDTVNVHRSRFRHTQCGGEEGDGSNTTQRKSYVRRHIWCTRRWRYTHLVHQKVEVHTSGAPEGGGTHMRCTRRWRYTHLVHQKVAEVHTSKVEVVYRLINISEALLV